MSEKQTMRVFLLRTLENIISKTGRKQDDIKKSAKRSIEIINEYSTQLDEFGDDPQRIDNLCWFSNQIVNTLKLCCVSQVAKIMTLSLDCIHKLMSYGYFRGELIDETNPEKKLINTVIDSIRLSFDNTTDDSVRLQIVKVFLISVTSPHCDVHENSLMVAVRTCYNVYLITKNEVNRTTAKATLTQMLNSIFARMDTQSKISSKLKKMVTEKIMSEILEQVKKQTKKPISVKENGENKENVSKEGNVEGQLTNGEENKEVPKKKSTQKLTKKQIDTIVYKDCSLIFIGLCKLAEKELDPSILSDPESIELRSKILSLELLLSILETSGKSFKESKKFVNEAIKKALLKALVPNYFSNIPSIFDLSLKIFSCLMTHFKEYLKGEIGVFFHKVLLHTLENNNSSNAMKQMVIEVLLKICRTPKTLVEIFVNYDCDIDSKDIFERMVNDLSQITKNNTNAKLKELSLQTLVSIMRSLVDRSKNLYELEKQEKVNSVKEENRSSEKRESDLVNSKSSVDLFEKQKTLKLILEEGKKLFVEKPKKGIAFLIEKGFIKKDSPEVIAEYLLTNNNLLDFAAIGDFISDINEQSKQILYAYVEMIAFKGMEIDIALRFFLKGFRLPGEGQKIDRLMEKFAEKYYNDNVSTTTFANADAAYMVAFATIMLTTDLHKNKKYSTMTKEAFKKNLRGLNDGKDFEENFLMGVYERVAAEPFVSQDDSQAFFSDGTNSMKQSIIQHSSHKSTYHESNNVEHVRPMFKRSWAPMLASFSVLLKAHKEHHITEMCIEGFKSAIHISCIFGLDDERNSFMNALSQFTMFNSHTEIQQKNVDAIKTVMVIATTEGNFLKNSWYQVLQCISNLDRLRLLRIQMGHDEKNKRDDENSNLLDQIVIDERIFTSCVSLNDDAIVDFARSLSEVSKEDISRNSTFSLQKLVEISAYNMSRIRIVWSSIWKLLSEHFVEVACLENKEIAMTAIDSLRQLAFKYLEKDELSNYNFQKEFLKPFEDILKGSKNNDMKNMVLDCLNLLIAKKAHNIKSGWKSIFTSFTIASEFPHEAIVKNGFGYVKSTLDLHWAEIKNAFFIEAVNCLVAYANNHQFKMISLDAIVMLRLCAKRLYGGEVIILSVKEDGVMFSEQNAHTKLWFPLLTGLAKVVNHAHIDVRSSALDALRNILVTTGGSFSEKLWGLILNGVLLPIFDNVKHTSLSEKDKEWLTTTCLKALNSLLKLFATHFNKLCGLLGEFLILLVSCILQENKSLATDAATCLLSLVIGNCNLWTKDMWDLICQAFVHIFRYDAIGLILEATKNGEMPKKTCNFVCFQKPNNLKLAQQLEKATPEEIKDPTSNKSIKLFILEGKCNVQSILVQAINEIIKEAFNKLETDHLVSFLDCVYYSYTCGNGANNHQILIENLSIKKTILDKLLVRKEHDGLSIYLTLLSKMINETEKDVERRVQVAEDRIIDPCTELISDVSYEKPLKELPPNRQEYRKSKFVILNQVLDVIKSFTDNQFKKYCGQFYQPFVDLVLSDAIEYNEIRVRYQELIIRAAKLFGILNK